MGWLMIRKILPCFVLLFFAASCTGKSKETKEIAPKKLHVLSTTAMIDDFVGILVKDRMAHEPLIIGELDPHSYELVKGDDEKFFKAGLVFSNGLGLEHGASLRYHLQKHRNVVEVGESVRKELPESVLFVDGQVDPHIWMDVSLWKECVIPMAEALSQADPEGREFYFKNALELKEDLEMLHEEIFQKLQGVSENKRYLVTSHDAFNYFTRAYLSMESERLDNSWKKRFAAPEGISPEGQLSVFDIKMIVEHLCLHHIGVVFPESNVNRDSLRKITNVCKEKGLEIKLSQEVLYSDALGSKSSGADDYFSMMRHNTQILCEEWR